jgi:hypothetical protein
MSNRVQQHWNRQLIIKLTNNQLRNFRSRPGISFHFKPRHYDDRERKWTVDALFSITSTSINPLERRYEDQLNDFINTLDISSDRIREAKRVFTKDKSTHKHLILDKQETMLDDPVLQTSEMTHLLSKAKNLHDVVMSKERFQNLQLFYKRHSILFEGKQLTNKSIVREFKHKETGEKMVVVKSAQIGDQDDKDPKNTRSAQLGLTKKKE